MERTLGLIPARKGSKGIVGKNTRLLAGRPLLQYAVDCALQSPEIDKVIVSTDSQATADLASMGGAEVPFLRPESLARDDTPMLDVMQHAVRELEGKGWSPEFVVLLQPTAPLRKPAHIRQAFEIMEATGCDSVVSVVEVPGHYLPHFVMKIEDDCLRFFLPEGESVTRRQDAPPAYSRNGTVYVTRRDVVMEQNSIYGRDCRPMIMSHSESVNLDTLEDWYEAEAMIKGG